MAKTYLATSDTFTKQGRFVARGQLVTDDEVDFDKDNSPNLMVAPKGANMGLAVEVSAIAPSGPNPVNPQQIANDAVQTPAGYEQAGVRLVGEVTKPSKQRIELVGIDTESTAQADVTDALAKHDASGKGVVDATPGEADTGKK